MKTQDAITQRLNELIEKNKLTINELSIRTSVAPSTIKNIIYGKSKNPGTVTLYKICQGFNITLREFYNSAVFDDIDQDID